MTAPRPRPQPRRTPALDDQSRRLYTLEEYYELTDDGTSTKYEFVRGQVFAMAPPPLKHQRIGTNVVAKLYQAAGDGSCRVYQDAGVLIDGEILYIPDVMAACGPEPDDEHCEHAPCFVAEVLSRSTRVADLRDKAPNYRRLPSLQLLLLIERSLRRVDCYRRDAAGAWQHETIIGQGEIPVPCPGADGPTALTLDEIYRGVTFPPPRRRVREDAPAWGGEEAPAWMLDPADLAPEAAEDEPATTGT